MLTYWGNKASGNQKELQSYLQLHQQAVDEKKKTQTPQHESKK
jgi:hypothetical protein